jgi:hypothetical protein
VSEIFYAKINLALLAAALFAGSASAEEPQPVTSDDQACARVMAALAAKKAYRAGQMANCDVGKDGVYHGYYTLRLNGHCRDLQGCGSVLLGWYAVDEKTGAVFEMDLRSGWNLGPRIDRDK